LRRLLITRQIAEPVIAAARARFDVTLGRDALSEDAAAQALRDFDAILPTLGDAFSAGAFAAAGVPRCRMLGNFGVGFNHIDVEAARAAGVMVSNTPDVMC